VWLRAHRPIPADFQIEQQLVGVKLLAEAAEGWPLEVIRGRSSEISVEDEFSILFGDMQLVLVRIEDFDSVLRAFGERYAMRQAYSCEPSARGSGWPAQPGISSLVRRGLSA